MKLTSLRSALYGSARAIGDYQAAASASPTKIVKRVARKAAGRKYGSIVGRILR